VQLVEALLSMFDIFVATDFKHCVWWSLWWGVWQKLSLERQCDGVLRGEYLTIMTMIEAQVSSVYCLRIPLLWYADRNARTYHDLRDDLLWQSEIAASHLDVGHGLVGRVFGLRRSESQKPSGREDRVHWWEDTGGVVDTYLAGG
jgi:hypothetical protein